ncbi:hypothetical protein [Enterobacter asburiae]|uniref:hypothetical protein n=1 Tax=Enterobacter asburiae TaxID=61645 RepID=UPI00210DF880|nr:hypothetical protein [Enterobacter asburiae]MCQ4368965.1 hypothetical protein [Enterobacter asburiae]HDC4620865.1 hypothetical protein [Enterobacter asburiae]
MHRIDTPTAQADKFGQGKNGFTNGDPATGRRATDLNSDMWDAVQEEICTAIESAGLTLDKTKHDQLYQAIVKIITSKIPDALLRENNLSDVVDKALSRGNLGLKTAAIADVTTSNIDTTGGRVLKVGDYGLTRAINVASGTNVVTFLASAPGSFYHFDSSTSYTNAPNFGGGWFDVYMTIHEATNYRTIIAVSSSGTMAYAAITNGSFSGWSYPFTSTGGNLSGNLQISTAAPIIQMSETDTGKQYYIIVDGSGFRINEDGPSGKVVLAYSANSSRTTTTGQFVPADYGNFDNRYPVRDAINYVGLEADNPLAPYMRRISTNTLVYLASRDWVNGNFATTAWVNGNFATTAWVNGNFISSARRGGQVYQAGSGSGQGMAYEAPAGCFMTGINTLVADGRGMGVYYRALQVYIPSRGYVQIGD